MEHLHQNGFQQQYADLDCPLCTGQNFAVMFNRALYDRYLANVNLYYTDAVDDFVEEEITPQTCKFREQMCDCYDEELLKRQYAAHEFPGKIEMLSEYYKFHRDIPKIFEKSVFRILGKHYDKLRHFDYKKIKCVLKAEQGISLTTEKSEESSFCSDQIIKSKYSTVLHDLNQNSQSQSQILHNFCEKVEKAFQNVKFKPDFKGQYFSGEKKFEQYLLNAKKNHPKSNKLHFLGTGNNEKLKNYNLLHKPLAYPHINNLSIKTQRLDMKKRSLKKKGTQVLQPTHKVLKESIKNFKKIKNKESKSIQKTTANQTISRQEKSRRMQKLQKTLQYEIEKNQNSIFKPFSTGLIGLKSNAMLKTLQQIYKPSNSVHEKYHSDKSSKILNHNAPNLQKIYQTKLSGRKSQAKIRAKIQSEHNSKQINTINPQPIKQLINLNENPPTQRQRLSLKRNSTTRCSSQKKLVRSKSATKTLGSNMKASQKQLNTIEQLSHDKRQRSKSHHRVQNCQNNNMNNFLKQKTSLMTTDMKPRQLKQRSSSKKNLNSTKKLNSSSKKNLNHTKQIQRSASKSHVTSARGVHPDNSKFHTIDHEANKNLQKYLQRKLTIVQKPKPMKAKFYN